MSVYIQQNEGAAAAAVAQYPARAIALATTKARAIGIRKHLAFAAEESFRILPLHAFVLRMVPGLFCTREFNAL